MLTPIVTNDVRRKLKAGKRIDYHLTTGAKAAFAAITTP